MYVNVVQYGGGMVSLIALIYIHKQVQGAGPHGFSLVYALVVDTRAQVFNFIHTNTTMLSFSISPNDDKDNNTLEMVK